MDSVFDLLEKDAPGEGGQPTIEDPGHRFSFDELRARLHRRARRLQTLGVGHGDRVLIARPNSVEWVISTLAVMRLGAIAVPINPQATAREVGVYEDIVEPRGAVVDDITEQTSNFSVVLPAADEPDADPSGTDLPPPPSGEDRALILFTSGTTGFPKAAVQLHRTLILSGQGFVHWLDLSPRDRLLVSMPLFHANGIYYSLMGGLCGKADIVIAPRFSASRFWDTVVRARATQVNLMGPMLSILLKQPERAEERAHSLRIVYTAGAPHEILAAFAQRFEVDVVEGYGLTETPFGCINPRGAARPGSIGMPRQHPSAAISNSVDITDSRGRSLAAGEVGEIVIRNGATLVDYWNDPAATKAAFRDGWLRTGDLGYRDPDGYFFIVGRKQEIIRRKGVNIAPREIELTMSHIPDVNEAAVIGLPSPLGEELVIAVATLNPGVSAEGAERRIMARLAKVVTREKLPDEVVIAKHLPKAPTQRIEKAKLRAWLRQHRTRRVR